MRVILIGGNGFIGKNLALRLIQSEFNVIIYDCCIDPLSANSICGNLTDYYLLDDLIKEGDVVIHLASSNVPVSSGHHISQEVEENIIPTLKLFEMACKKKVKKIIFSSSGGAVYGIPDYTPIDEKHPTNPISTYGIMKVCIENYLKYYGNMYGIQTFSLRLSNPYGYAQRPFTGQGVIATYLASINMQKPIEIWGSDKSVKDYIYIDDVAEAFKAAITDSVNSGIYNIGTGIGTTIDELINMIHHTLPQNKIVRKYQNDNLSNVTKNVLNCGKAGIDLRWTYKVKIESGIIKMNTMWNNKKCNFENIQDGNLNE